MGKNCQDFKTIDPEDYSSYLLFCGMIAFRPELCIEHENVFYDYVCFDGNNKQKSSQEGIYPSVFPVKYFSTLKSFTVLPPLYAAATILTLQIA